MLSEIKKNPFSEKLKKNVWMYKWKTIYKKGFIHFLFHFIFFIKQCLSTFKFFFIREKEISREIKIWYCNFPCLELLYECTYLRNIRPQWGEDYLRGDEKFL